ncbi:hypothetical protein ACHQM5_016986 [Ranunculus cassubicifolius]
MSNLFLSFYGADDEDSSERARQCFQWGGTISALVLLSLNPMRQSSRTQTSLLVAYLISSLPTVLFNIIRGEFGHWVAFFAVAGNLFFPRDFSASRFPLFVIIPGWISHELRNTMLGGILCLIIGVLLLVDEIQGIGGCGNCEGNILCLCYCLGIFFLFFFTLLYLWRGPW